LAEVAGPVSFTYYPGARNDQKVGEGRVEKTVPARFSADETFHIGIDSGSPVSADYESPNPYRGIIKDVKIELRRSTLSDAAEKQVRVLQERAAVATDGT
jgi:arylsulfatase